MPLIQLPHVSVYGDATGRDDEYICPQWYVVGRPPEDLLIVGHPAPQERIAVRAQYQSQDGGEQAGQQWHAVQPRAFDALQFPLFPVPDDHQIKVHR